MFSVYVWSSLICTSTTVSYHWQYHCLLEYIFFQWSLTVFSRTYYNNIGRLDATVVFILSHIFSSSYEYICEFRLLSARLYLLIFQQSTANQPWLIWSRSWRCTIIRGSSSCLFCTSSLSYSFWSRALCPAASRKKTKMTAPRLMPITNCCFEYFESGSSNKRLSVKRLPEYVPLTE